MISARRRFLHSTLATGTLLACPPLLRSALAAESGRALIGFQGSDLGTNVLVAFMTELRTRYSPDLGSRPIVMPGASGALASETVNKSAPDGATMLIAPSSLATLVPIMRKSPDDVVKRLVPVAGIGEVLLAVVVGPGVPMEVKTLTDYLAWVRANPASNTFGVPGLGAAPHFVGNELSRLSNVPLRVAAYKGPFAVEMDLLIGSLPAAITVMPDPASFAKHPNMRALAMTSVAGKPRFPTVPTLQESGFDIDFPAESLGCFLPAGTPAEKQRELHDAILAANQTPSVVASMWEMGMPPMTSPGENYASAIARERAAWLSLVTTHNFTG